MKLAPFCLCVALLPFNAMAEAAESRLSGQMTRVEVMRSLQEYFSGWQTLSADYVMEAAPYNTGKLYVQRPDKIVRVEAEPEAYRYVRTGSGYYQAAAGATLQEATHLDCGDEVYLEKLLLGAENAWQEMDARVEKIEESAQEVAVVVAYQLPACGAHTSRSLMKFEKKPLRLKSISTAYANEDNNQAAPDTVTYSDIKKDVPLDPRLFE